MTIYANFFDHILKLTELLRFSYGENIFRKIIDISFQTKMFLKFFRGTPCLCPLTLCHPGIWILVITGIFYFFWGFLCPLNVEPYMGHRDQDGKKVDEMSPFFLKREAGTDR